MLEDLFGESRRRLAGFTIFELSLWPPVGGGGHLVLS